MFTFPDSSDPASTTLLVQYLTQFFLLSGARILWQRNSVRFGMEKARDQTRLLGVIREHSRRTFVSFEESLLGVIWKSVTQGTVWFARNLFSCWYWQLFIQISIFASSDWDGWATDNTASPDNFLSETDGSVQHCFSDKTEKLGIPLQAWDPHVFSHVLDLSMEMAGWHVAPSDSISFIAVSQTQFSPFSLWRNDADYLETTAMTSRDGRWKSVHWIWLCLLLSQERDNVQRNASNDVFDC